MEPGKWSAINKRGRRRLFGRAMQLQRAAAEKKSTDDDSRNTISCSLILPNGVIILLNNDILGSISSFLACKDLFHLSLTCKKMTGAIEDVALQMIGAAQVQYGGDNEEDMPALKQIHSCSKICWEKILAIYGEIKRVSTLLIRIGFTLLNIDFKGFEPEWDGWEGTCCTAICSDYVMTSGRHYAKFTVTSERYGEDAFRYFYCRLGIMRPMDSYIKKAGWPQWSPLHSPVILGSLLDESFSEHCKTDAWGEGDVHSCLYHDFQGTCAWSNWDSTVEGIHEDLRWDGMLGLSLLHDTREYGLLLDLDAGTLSMYKDDRCLGVMMRGLTGEYCWVANILAQAHGRPDEQNVHIERAPVPW